MSKNTASGVMQQAALVACTLFKILHPMNNTLQGAQSGGMQLEPVVCYAPIFVKLGFWLQA